MKTEHFNLYLVYRMETEKMKAHEGLLYDANYDAELLAERTACADRLYEYNLLRPSQEEKRVALLRELLGKTKEHLCIVSPFHCDYGYNIEVGENFFMNTVRHTGRSTGDVWRQRIHCAPLWFLYRRASVRRGATQPRAGVCLPHYDKR